MASTDQQKQRKPDIIQRRPMMLKDYLRDDLLSSCSSNGFKSFPRRQCCTTMRFLLEVDLKASRKQRPLRRSRSKAAASTTISALQRASEAVISAVKKQLSFHSVKSHSPSQRDGDKTGLVPRNLSRKLFFGRRFWRKTDKRDNDLRRWRLFRDILNEQDKPSDHHSAATSVVGGLVSMSNSSSCNTDSWAESEFTSEILGSSSGKSESSSENHVVGGKPGPPEREREFSRSIGETVGVDISEATTATFSGANSKDWSNEKEKEQFSPVSVLDCSFHEEDHEDTSSPSSHDKLGRIEGTKQKLSHKIIRQLECLHAHDQVLEPVDLEKRIALMSADLNHEITCSILSTSLENSTFDNHRDQKMLAEQLLNLINTRSSVKGAKLIFKASADMNLLSDFFLERIEENINASASTAASTRSGRIVNGFGIERELLKVAEDWLNGGNPLELFLGWEIENGREVYVRDMEKGGMWRILAEDKGELGLEVESEVWNSLLDELLLDLTSFHHNPYMNECFGKSLA